MASPTGEIPPTENPAPSATLRVVLPTGDAFDRDLGQAEIRLGKGPRNDIVIADPAVSTAHAMITAEPGGFTLSDLGSRNGTFVAGERLSSPRRLSHGDVISIGRSKITFRLPGFTNTETIDVDQAELQPAPLPPTEESVAAAAVEAGLVAADQLAQLRASAGSRSLYRVLIDDAKVDQTRLRDLMSRVFGIPVAVFEPEGLPEQTLAEFPSRLAMELNAVPVSRTADGWLVAIADPTDNRVVEDVSRRLHSNIEPRLATADEIEHQLARYYGPKLVGVLPSGDRLEFPLAQREVKIGKAPHNDIILSDPTVSNSHAIILSQGNGYEIVDLESRNGTFVDGERLGAEARVLLHGDNIQVGRSLLVFRSSTHTGGNTTATLAPELLAELRKQARVDSQEIEAVANPARAGSAAPPLMAGVSPPATPEVAAVGAGTEPALTAAELEEKKKKKKSKEDKRLRAAWIGAASRILAQVLGPLFLLGISVYVLQRQMSPSTGSITSKTDRAAKMAKAVSASKIQGGPFEASGVVQIPETDGELLFIDDGNSGSVFWMKVDQAGRQIGETESITLGVNVEDPESITYGGGYFWVLGSQANPSQDARPGLVRFRLDGSHHALAGQPEATPDLLNFLMTNTPELAGQRINIEGIAWDPVGERLLLGLRSPLERGKALIVPLKLIDPSGPFAAANLSKPETMKLSLDGFGIRDLQYNTKLKAYLILSGASEHHQKLDFRLWEWSGDPAADPVVLDVELDPDMKPEGVTHVRASGRDFVFVVGDSSRYTKIDYTDAVQ